MSQGLAADSLGAEDLGEVELGGPLEISRTCRSGLASAWCLRQTFVRRNVYLGPRLCFRLEELQEGGCCRSWLVVTVFSHCWHLHSGFSPATRCVLTKELVLLNMFFNQHLCRWLLSSFSHPHPAMPLSFFFFLCQNPFIIWLESSFACRTLASRSVWPINEEVDLFFFLNLS